MSTIEETITVRRISGRIGAEMNGVRLSGALDHETTSLIRKTVLEHKVVFFRGQDHLDNAAHEAFASLLGDPTIGPGPNMGNHVRGAIFGTSPNGGYSNEEGAVLAAEPASMWHVDRTFEAAYPAFTVLRVITVPPYGGETVWANTAAAYNDLPDVLQHLADQLWVVHSNVDNGKKSAIYGDMSRPVESVHIESGQSTKQYNKTIDHVTSSLHPLVCVHPETAERALVLGAFARSIVGFSAPDSLLLCQLFNNHMIRLENTARWHWDANDVAVWDNRSTQHYALDDYEGLSRETRRIMIAGEPRMSVEGSYSHPYSAA